MAAVIGALRAELSANVAKFTSDMGKASGEVARFATRFDKIGTRLTNIGGAMTAGITAPFLALVAVSVPAATEAAQASGQVEAALKSMGDQAGRTKEQLDANAEALMRTSTFDDDEILSKVTANLLTFGNVAGEQFDRAQQAALDMATRLRMDLQPATLLVGKALNDPVKGMAALRRVGIQLTEDQQKLVKSMAATGNMAGAQAVILGELERQFGGAALAMREATPGQDLKNAWDDFQETLGGIVLNILPPLTAFLSQVLDGFNELSPGMQKVALIAAAVAAAMGPLLVVVGQVAVGIGALAPLFAGAGAGGAVAAGGLGAIAAAALPVVAVVAALVAAFLLFKDKLIPVFDAFRAKFSEVLGPKFGAMIESVKAALVELWNGPLGAAIRVVIDVLGDLAAVFATVLGEGLIRIVSAAIDIIGGMFRQIVNIVDLIAALFRGDWSAAWAAMKAIVATSVETLLKVLNSLAPGAIDAMRRLYEGVRRWLVEALGRVLDAVMDKVRAVGDGFRDLWDRVVGHSYVPDMVKGVAEWMAKLDAGMVVPARRATRQTAEAFEDLRSDVADIMDGLLTDSERNMREIARQVARMREGIAAGIVDPALGQRAIDALQTERLDPIQRMEPLNPLDGAEEWLRLQREWREEAASAAKESAEAFGDTFADVAERVFSGDIKGVLIDLLRNFSRGLLKDVGTGLYDMFKSMFASGPGGAGSGGIGSIMSAIFNRGGIAGQGGGIGSLISSAASSIFGGFRAEGGPVVNGKSYIVGERGPELFTPGSSGLISSNDSIGGSGTVYIDARGAGPREIDELRKVLREYGENFKEMSWDAMNEGLARERIAAPTFAG